MTNLSVAPELEVREVEGLNDLGLRCADEILNIFRARQAVGEVPSIALTGGRAGAAVLTALGERAAASQGAGVDWSRVRFVWGDERWLPAGDAERNDLLADNTLFQVVQIDESHVHRVVSSSGALELEAAASTYSSIVATIGQLDIVLCGVGEDAHIASLFPGREDLLIDAPGTPNAIAVRESPKPPAERVTLTLPALKRSARVWLLACGAGKAEAIADLRSKREPLVPAARVWGHQEVVLWADAAALGATE